MICKYVVKKINKTYISVILCLTNYDTTVSLRKSIIVSGIIPEDVGRGGCRGSPDRLLGVRHPRILNWRTEIG